MDTQEISIHDASKGGGTSFEFMLKTPGFIGNFRITYWEKTRKNSVYRQRGPLEVYFLGFPHGMTCARASDATDAILFVERKAQWLIEQIASKLGV